VPQDKRAEIEFFDSFSNTGEYDVFSERGYARILGEFARHLPNRRPLRCVDLGCGTGDFTARLRPLGLDLHGVDLSPNAVRLARQRFPDITFHVGDIEQPELEAGSFDVVVFSGVLHHFPELERAVAESWRLLAPGGLALAYDPHRGNPFFRLLRCHDSPLYSSKGVTPNEQPLSRCALQRAFTQAGFRAEVYPISGVGYKYVEGPARLAIPAYNLFDRLLDKGPLRRFGAFLITVARKPS